MDPAGPDLEGQPAAAAAFGDLPDRLHAINEVGKGFGSLSSRADCAEKWELPASSQQLPMHTSCRPCSTRTMTAGLSWAAWRARRPP